MGWNLTFSQELVEKKKKQLQDRLSENQKGKSSNKQKQEQNPFEDQNQGKPDYSNMNFREKSEQKDKFKDLALNEFLQLQELDDFDRYIKNIVQMFHFSPVKLKIPADIQKFLYDSVLYEINEPAKEINVKISANYEVIPHKKGLYLATKIMIVQLPASNFDPNRFDVHVYCETGELICSFHNFDAMERLLKYFKRKLKRIQTIYFLHVFNGKSVSLDLYFQAKMVLELQNSRINLKGVLYNSQKSQGEDLSEQTIPQQYLNAKQMNQHDFERFLLENSIQQIKSISINPDKELSESQVRRFTKAVIRKMTFDNSILRLMSFGDQEIFQYRKRNEISLKLINYCFSKLSNEMKGNQSLNPSRVKQVFAQLIDQIVSQKQKLQTKLIQRIIQEPQNHQIQPLDTDRKPCMKCKHKTKYRCKKCSLKYEMEVMVCKNCFEDFHSDQYFKGEALAILTRKNKVQNGLAKYRYKSNRTIKKQSNRNRVKQKAYKLKVLKGTQNEQINKQGKMDEQNGQKILDPLKEYTNMRRFIFTCQQTIKFS